MKDITTALMQQFRREHKAARRYMALLLALALLTSLFVNWQLHSVGIAQTADYQCGEIEHQHTAECYEKVLVCGYEEANRRTGTPQSRTTAQSLMQIMVWSRAMPTLPPIRQSRSRSTFLCPTSTPTTAIRK